MTCFPVQNLLKFYGIYGLEIVYSQLRAIKLSIVLKYSLLTCFYFEYRMLHSSIKMSTSILKPRCQVMKLLIHFQHSVLHMNLFIFKNLMHYKFIEVIICL